VTAIRPRLDCLPPSQQALWPKLSAVRADFVLYGGTALTLQVGDRISVDFDFFSPQEFDPDELSARYPFLKGASLLQRAKATATYSVAVASESVKISFFGGLDFGRVSDPVLFGDNGIYSAGLLDLAAQKVKVVQARAEAKDYLDVNTLMQAGMTLELSLGAAATLYPGFNPAVSLKALGYFEDVPDVPPLVRRNLLDAVSRVRQIPHVPKADSSLLPKSL
jgi:nucleotidyltransferase AbiEii toxin of type IV toxin-antitoxin system